MAIIGVDADGTLFTHEYPSIGKDIGATSVLLELLEAGHKLILYTMRSGKELDDAVEWCTCKGIPLYGVNSNPTQHKWTSSPKVYCNCYIDDAGLGIPLIRSNNERPYVDWIKVRELLVEQGYLTN
jgi:hypothetical protein